MFNKSAAQNEPIVLLLTEIRDLLKEGRFNAILTGVLAGVDNDTITRAAGPLVRAAIETESETRKVKP